jgi:hypothetical protein
VVHGVLHQPAPYNPSLRPILSSALSFKSLHGFSEEVFKADITVTHRLGSRWYNILMISRALRMAMAVAAFHIIGSLIL